MDTTVDPLAHGQTKTFRYTLSNVEAKAMVNTLAKTLKCKKGRHT